MFYEFPTKEELFALAKTYSFEKLKISQDTFIYSGKPDDIIGRFWAGPEILSWYVHLRNRLAQVRWSYLMAMFYVNKGIANLSHLRDLGQQVNRKLLEVERVSQQCVLSQDALDRLQSPTVEAGQRASALRFGDPRVMALLQAIAGFPHLPRGFRNRDLPPQVQALLARPYTQAQMT